MASSTPDKTLFLSRTSSVSLHERFSQVMMKQQTRPSVVTYNSVLPLQQMEVARLLPVVIMMKKEDSPPLGLQSPDVSNKVKQRLKRSVWTRLGWQQVTRRPSASRPRGFWSFINKYKWRVRLASTHRGRGNQRSRLGWHGFPRRTTIQKLTAGQHLSVKLPRGRATAVSRNYVPTKKQLDAQLDEYMSLSRSRLDQQLENYMSRSRSRLDAQLDEYMAMAGEV